MSEVNAELVDHYWSRVDLLALEAEAGELITSELASLMADAVDAFADTATPDLHLESLVGDLQITADSYREARPSYAAVFARAALLAMKPAAEPA